MPETKFSAPRTRNLAGQRESVSQPIRQIDHPGRQKEDRAISEIESDMKGPRKKPEPGQRDERGVETDQIQPD